MILEKSNYLKIKIHNFLVYDKYIVDLKFVNIVLESGKKNNSSERRLFEKESKRKSF